MTPAAIRYKNPGAMWPSKLATKWGSRDYVTLNDGQGNKIAIFPTFVQGAAAQLDLWRTSQNYRGRRLADAIRTWSGGDLKPPEFNHNSWQDYVRWMIAKVPGLTASTILNDAFWQSWNGVQFLKAQAMHEAGQPMPMSDAEWMEAQRLVFAGNPVEVDDTDKIMPLVRIGDSGSAVEAMQRLLGCAIDGRYRQRSETEYALRLFQIRNGLDPDGICGPRTWDKLQPEKDDK